MQSTIINVLENINFRGQEGSLQYWEYEQVGQKEVLILKDQYVMSTQGKIELKNYRKRCFANSGASVALDTKVDQEWLAGLAAQMRVPCQRTSRGRPNQFFGQLVVPVYSYQGADKKFAGIFELTTNVPKKSYDEEFTQIQELWKANTIKVIYGNDTYKFPLPLSCGIAKVWEKMKERNTEVNQNQETFWLEYKDGNGYLKRISNDGDLRACIANSRTTAIYMILKRGA